MKASTKDKYTQRIPTRVNRTTTNPESQHYALSYPDLDLRAKSLNKELHKIDCTGSIKWLTPDELGVTPKNTKQIPLTVTFKYK